MTDSILRLKVESQEYDNKLKRAAQGLQQYADQCRKAGGTLESVEKDTLDFVKAIGRMETVTKTAKGSLGEMTASFTQFKMIYKQMSDAEKQSPVGKALAQSLDQLKIRIKETQRDLQDINKELQGGNGKFGQFGNVIDQLGSKMGVTGNITELLTSKTALLTGAIGVGTTAVVAATKAWADYNSEIAKQQQITTVTTGLNGTDADKMTAAARALSKTYGVDFRETINAANTLMTQFGKTGDEAIQLLRDGMRGMIQGDGPKMLSMIQQFAPAFLDAGISADKLVAIIHNSEGGLFSEQNMNAILMGIKNIRLMTKATSDALAQLGINGEEMTKRMSDGSMTVFEALTQVSYAIEGAKAGSQEAGQVMQAVFGRQGAMQGMKLGRAIAELNTNLEETKRQTGEVGDAFDKLYSANVKLEKALQDTFGYKGWEEMSIGIKTKLITAMANVLELANKINNVFKNNFGVSYFEAVYNSATRAIGPLGTMLRLLKDINKEKSGSSQANTPQKNQDFEYIKGGVTKQEREQRYDKVLADINKNLANIGQEKTRKNSDGSTSFYIDPLDVQQQQRQQLLNQRTQLILNRDALMKGNPTAPTPEPFTPFTPTTKTTGGKSGMTDAQREQELIDRIANQLATAQAKSNILVDQEFAAGKMVREMPSVYQMMLPEIQKQILDKKDFDLKKVLKEYVSDPDKDKRKQKDINETDKFASDFSKITGSVSSIASGLQALGVEIPDGLAKTIAVVQTISGILTAILAITTAIQATSSVNATASVIDAVVPFARGGKVPKAASGYYVPGRRTSGDTTPILANAGELVLNKSSQSNLAAMIRNAESLVGMIDRYQNSFLSRTQYGNEAANFSGGAMQNLRLSASISGEQIRLVLKNNGRRTGRGEYVTSNFTRG